MCSHKGEEIPHLQTALCPMGTHREAPWPAWKQIEACPQRKGLMNSAVMGTFISLAGLGHSCFVQKPDGLDFSGELL